MYFVRIELWETSVCNVPYIVGNSFSRNSSSIILWLFQQRRISRLVLIVVYKGCFITEKFAF